MNVNIEKVVLQNAPLNAQYISNKIQKEILSIYSTKVRKRIRDEIGVDGKFCILVDEALDDSKKEQMAIIISDICKVLGKHNLLVSNMRGQGYDGASNMSGEWSGLQELFLNDCPYAYYIHCFAHRLQLALNGAAKEIISWGTRFPYETVELISLSSALDPHDAFKWFNIDDICTLAEKFYLLDFTTTELHALNQQLGFYKIDMDNIQAFKNIDSILILLERLIETKLAETYYLIDRLIHLVLTISVSIATTERAFSCMRLIKNLLQNKIADEFLADCMLLHIERELADNIDNESIISDFDAVKTRRVQLI
ncbi:hypothetical protein L3X38_031844 [Prunus dulcis]|uniref:Zinc finger MYM-type protein 1-like n=1 Tax=Prunus dulcis TaxID=3755 RepID=A0AAD4VF60_PRUDU|nr:hypothetical protein L3X38_031844 [Prunus dulcis]